MIISTKQKEAINREIETFLNRIEELGADSVQVIATVQTDDDVLLEGGKGNFYARRGSVEAWLRIENDLELSNKIAESIGENNG